MQRDDEEPAVLLTPELATAGKAELHCTPHTWTRTLPSEQLCMVPSESETSLFKECNKIPKNKSVCYEFIFSKWPREN